MRKKDDKRNGRRISLDPPARGTLSHFPVRIVDLSTSGARIQHDSPLVFQRDRRFVLEFAYEGEEIRLDCCLARTRLEAGTSRRKVYTTGVRFVESDGVGLERLWGLMGWLAMDVLSHESVEDGTEFTIVAVTR
jgi:hypothetical protein